MIKMHHHNLHNSFCQPIGKLRSPILLAMYTVLCLTSRGGRG